ncbi:MAG TPA: hypothetical protein VK207_11955 [Bacteroidales bacterium]|nr:hypothetical protein [Bacteroidales bacterium]
MNTIIEFEGDKYNNKWEIAQKDVKSFMVMHAKIFSQFYLEIPVVFPDIGPSKSFTPAKN